MKKVVWLLILSLMLGIFSVPVMAEQPSIVAVGSTLYANGVKNLYLSLLSAELGAKLTDLTSDGCMSAALVQNLETDEFAEAVKNADYIVVNSGMEEAYNGILPLLKGKDVTVELIEEKITESEYEVLFNQLSLIFMDQYTAAITKIRSLNPNARLILNLVYNPFVGEGEKISKAANAHMNKIDTAIVLNALENNATIIDMFNLIKTKDDVLKYLNWNPKQGVYDIFPGTEGHKQMFELAKEAWFPISVTKNNQADETPYIEGYPDNSFRPDSTLTRAEAVTIFARLYTTNNEFKTLANFSDINSTHWAYNSIMQFANAKILRGYEDGTFRPDNNMTRAEFIYAISKILNESKPVVVYFNDTMNHWAVNEIGDFAAKKYVSGKGNNMFGPDEFITRAEAVKIINRVIGKEAAQNSLQIFNDLAPEHWAFGEIMSAVQ